MLGDFLRRRRKYLGKTRSQIAGNYCTPAEVSRLEAGGKYTAPPSLSDIMLMYEIPLEEQIYVKTLAAFANQTFPSDMVMRMKYFELLYVVDELLLSDSEIDATISFIKENYGTLD